MELKANSGLNIAKVLGHGNTPSLIISSATFAVILFFYIFTVGSYFHVSVSPLVNRVNYHEPFAAYIINEFFDHLIIAYGMVLWLFLSLRGKARIVSSSVYGVITAIAISVGLQALFDAVALLSIPILISFLIFNRLASKKILRTTNLSLTYLAILGIITGFAGMIALTAPLFSVFEKSIPIHDYPYEILLLLSNLSPILVLFLVICSPFRLFMKKFITVQNKNLLEPSSSHTVRSQTKILYLLFFMLLSVTIGLIPHLPTINHDNQQVGSDSSDYVILIKKLMEPNNPREVIQKAFTTPLSSDRPISTLF